MTQDPACIFCQIANHTAESSILYEDTEIIAFMTLKQSNPGEFLVIPKEHIDHFCDLPDELTSRLMVQAQRLSRNLRGRLKPTRVGLVVHGFGVPHAHLVVVPLHDSSDITSGKYAYIDDGQIKFDDRQIPSSSRAKLDKLAKLLR